jgi:hypothetical protein
MKRHGEVRVSWEGVGPLLNRQSRNLSATSKHLLVKFMVPTMLLVFAIMALFGWAVARVLQSEIRDRAGREAENQANGVPGNLETIDALRSGLSAARQQARGTLAGK